MSNLTIDQAREMHVADLRALDHPIAQRQSELRDSGAERVRGVLRTVIGHGYSGTSGWHVLAFAAPDGAIGFVNTAQGVAVLTDATLDADVIEALTIPGQTSGPKASGAVAWTSPDAGEAHRSEAPRGWMQLMLDLRGDVLAVSCTVHVCAWGLRTCYGSDYRVPDSPGERGVPGAQALDAFDAGSDNPRRLLLAVDWPLERDDLERMQAAAQPILRRIALQLAQLGGVRAEVEAALDTSRPAGPVYYAVQGRGEPRLPRVDAQAAISIARRSAAVFVGSDSHYNAAGALRSVVAGVEPTVHMALRRHGITRLCAIAGDTGPGSVGGMRHYDLFVALLELILLHDLLPAAEALWTAMAARAKPDADSPPGWHLDLHVLQPMLSAIAPLAADQILRDVGESTDERAIFSALYRDGYIEVAIPISLGATSS